MATQASWKWMMTRLSINHRYSPPSFRFLAQSFCKNLMTNVRDTLSSKSRADSQTDSDAAVGSVMSLPRPGADVHADFGRYSTFVSWTKRAKMVITNRADRS